jgi:hypothetical protein
LRFWPVRGIRIVFGRGGGTGALKVVLTRS